MEAESSESHGRKLNQDAEQKRKEDVVELQCHMTRLGPYRHKLPNAKEVEPALVLALLKCKILTELQRKAAELCYKSSGH